ncbi:metabotropic glutamate receptor 4-like [Physella acuta]|uniref:metabotropic glutamate receptor 4-like n=1 Tax=Physella acuta TaxID=109671 RepID=UPI0027DB7A99|nr:metabotropic glutamate receptor 4-like [Physella acuta]
MKIKLIVSVLCGFIFLTFSSKNLVRCQCGLEPAPGDVLFYGLDRRVYAKPGDINIGALMMATLPNSENLCSDVIFPGSWTIEYTESVAFAVEMVNQQENLLPNITLGFYILNDCSSKSTAIAQSLAFLPRSESQCEKLELNTSTSGDSQQSPLPFYDVIGILSPIMSVSAAPISFLYTAAKIPLIGYSTTSDEFSDKSNHPYFFRVISPDKYQVEAILKFISDNGWSYLSIVYLEGTYGERAFDTIKTLAQKFGICLATWHRISYTENMDETAYELLTYPRARVVVAFIDEKPLSNLLVSLDRLNGTGQFVWVCSDAMAFATAESLASIKDYFSGAFVFSFYAPLIQEFYSYIERQNVLTSSNPWFKPTWESLKHCSFDAGTCDPNISLLHSTKFDFQTFATLSMDSVLALAQAADRVISALCPNATGTDVRDCVKSDDLYQRLRGEKFQGYSGRIEFNSNGDSIGKYVVYQMSYDKVMVPFGYGSTGNETVLGVIKREVAFYDVSSGNITYTQNNISWNHLKVVERIISLDKNSNFPNRPESVCSRPCVVGEYKIQKTPACCWDCRFCRNNERIINKNTACQECEPFTWPDPETNYTTCVPISLSHPGMSSPLSIIQISFAVVALLVTCYVTASYIYLRENRVIKAASRELSLIQILAIFAGYVTVISFQSYPTPNTCGVLYFMFCLSFATLYAPLLVKAVRIFRIFQHSSKTNKRPRFVSPQSQIIMSLVLILIQVTLFYF